MTPKPSFSAASSAAEASGAKALSPLTRIAGTKAPASLKRAPLLRQVAMHYFGSISLFVQRLAHRFRQHHGTVPPTRAAKGNRQATLPFPHIIRDQKNQQTIDP